jgi:hypothetical protein
MIDHSGEEFVAIHFEGRPGCETGRCPSSASK